MKKIVFSAACLVLMVFASSAWPQMDISMFGEEPSPEELGAPLYPGAEFIRIIDTLNPYYETAMYISLVPFEIVEDFFNRQLVEKRVVWYQDDELYMTVYLLKTWSRFPSKPTRGEIDQLDNEPNIRLRYYDPDMLAPVRECYENDPSCEVKVTTILKGETMILYTYEKTETLSGNEKVVGSWREVSRDLPGYFGTFIEFKSDSTYSYTATPPNIAALARDPFVRFQYGEMSEQELIAAISARNPEIGTFEVLSNTITLVSDNPLDGMRIKSGLVDIGTASLSLELINKPRLTFLKSP